MGPGHLGIGFAAKAIAPRAPLWVLLAASETLDLLTFGFIAVGIEKFASIQADITKGITILTPGIIHWSHGFLMSLNYF